MVAASCGDNTMGASQLAGCMALPSTSDAPGLPQVFQLRRAEMCPAGSPGRIAWDCIVRVSLRCRPRNCEAANTIDGSLGSGTTKNPSPPHSRVQCSLRMPLLVQLALGPIQQPLSWSPP